jgi:hypothetical protein
MAATGRQAIAFDDQRYNAQTFWADAVTIVFDATQPGGAAATMIGKAVSFAATADTVQLAADGEAIVGKLLKVEPDGACTVQNAGNTSLPAGTAATNTPGVVQVGALLVAARGYIRNAASGTPAETIRRGPICWDNADPTKIWVDFGG